MIRTLILAVSIFLVCTCYARAQDDFYDEGKIQEMRITFSQSNWSHILDSLFINVGDNGRLVGDAVINGKSLKKVGVRYKGFSSWNEGELKNPFNIDLDYKIKNQNYEGHTKLKLSNVIYDPSFVREVLSYEIARHYLPEPKANFLNLYINDSLIGLYTNVEAVDKFFVLDHYGSSTNTFFKGEPDTLVYPFGQNANLAYTHGDDSLAYKPFYNMESDYGWTNLLNFIKILNKSTDSIPLVLNTDRALWMHAFNYSLLNLDSYIGYSQNYYMYRDINGRFNSIIWDLNMSFGSFRDSDGSYNFQGITIPKLKILDPLEQLHFSISPRPLMTNLFKNDTFSRMYLAHIRTIMKENIMSGTYYSRAQELQSLIDSCVMKDSHKFYSYQDFLSNIDSTVGGVGTMIQYPGIKDLMEARQKYLSTYKGLYGEPLISWINHDPQLPNIGIPLWISAKVVDAKRVFLGYRYGSSAVFKRIPMLDDGNSHDGVANDGVYGTFIMPSDTIIQYYIYAENDSAGVFSPERAEYEFYTIQPETQPGQIVINEIMTVGDNLPQGENAVKNDWIELLNLSEDTISLKNFSLQSVTDGITWTFPDTTITPHKFLVIWADGAGGNHTDFTLSKYAGNLMLKNSVGLPLDSIEYGWQVEGKSTGRYPNGTGSFEFMEPTIGKNNFIGTTPANGFIMYPNPATDQITIEMSNTDNPSTLEIFNTIGQCIYSRQFDVVSTSIQSLSIPVDISSYKGMFLVKLSENGKTFTRKLIAH